MATPTQEEVRGLGDFAMYHKWNLYFYKFPTGITITTEELNLRAISVDLPKYTFDVSTTAIRGHEVHQTGIKKYNGQINMILVEGVTSPIADFIEEWSEMCWESITGIQRLKSEYEGGILLLPLNNQGEKRDGYKLIGCWPEDYDHGGTFDGSNSDSVKMQITWRYDYFLKV